MVPEFRVDKNGDTPVYLQIAERLTELIEAGVLGNGERLPPEREMAQGLAVARGTVQKAYEELVRRRVALPVRGRGTFVDAGGVSSDGGRLERAGSLIDSLLTELEELRFSPWEIRDLIHLKISERQEKKEGLTIAAVDCNPEALDMFHRQIAAIARLQVKKVLLAELANPVAAERRLRDFKLILCTATHFEELLALAPSLKKRIVRVVASPSRETILDLAGLGGAGPIGILCRSAQFMELVRRKLPDYGVSPGDAEGLLLSSGEDLEAFLRGKRALIVPPGYSFDPDGETRACLRRFSEKGGRLVSFDYRLERGSLLHLEEKIAELLGGEAVG